MSVWATPFLAGESSIKFAVLSLDVKCAEWFVKLYLLGLHDKRCRAEQNSLHSSKVSSSYHHLVSVTSIHLHLHSSPASTPTAVSSVSAANLADHAYPSYF